MGQTIVPIESVSLIICLYSNVHPCNRWLNFIQYISFRNLVFTESHCETSVDGWVNTADLYSVP